MNPPFQHTFEVGTASRSGPVRRHPGLAPRGGTEVISRWCGPSLGMQAALPGLGGVGSALWGHEEPSVHLEKERAWIAERPRPTPCPPAGPLIAETTQPARRVPAGSCPSPGILEGGSRSTPETSPSGRSCLISLLARRLGGPSPTPEVAGLRKRPGLRTTQRVCHGLCTLSSCGRTCPAAASLSLWTTGRCSMSRPCLGKARHLSVSGVSNQETGF